MIKLIIGSNTQRKTKIIDGKQSPKELFEEFNIDYTTGRPHLDGAPLTGAQMNQPMNDLTNADKAILITVVKSDGAVE